MANGDTDKNKDNSPNGITLPVSNAHTCKNLHSYIWGRGYPTLKIKVTNSVLKFMDSVLKQQKRPAG